MDLFELIFDKWFVISFCFIWIVKGIAWQSNQPSEEESSV